MKRYLFFMFLMFGEDDVVFAARHVKRVALKVDVRGGDVIGGSLLRQGDVGLETAS